MAADLLSDGVSLTLVTAQPGGAEFLQQAMLERGGATIPEIVTLVSDPEHEYLVKDAGDVFVIVTQDEMMDQKYQMVQPALVLIDKATGKTIPELTWSWKTMNLPNLEEDYEVSPGIELVAMRPVVSDLRAAIKERRPVKLSSVALSSPLFPSLL